MIGKGSTLYEIKHCKLILRTIKHKDKIQCCIVFVHKTTILPTKNRKITEIPKCKDNQPQSNQNPEMEHNKKIYRAEDWINLHEIANFLSSTT